MNFFVYGTLKIGGYFANVFDRVRVSHCAATLDGYVMYSIGESKTALFPGIVPGAGTIHGEVHTFKEEYKNEVLATMDSIEGFQEYDKKGSFYIRKKVTVTLNTGEKETVFAYVYNFDILDHYNKIENGVWDV